MVCILAFSVTYGASSPEGGGSMAKTWTLHGLHKSSPFGGAGEAVRL